MSVAACLLRVLLGSYTGTHREPTLRTSLNYKDVSGRGTHLMSQRVKVAVDVPESVVGETVETLWAERVEDGYRLLNSPWYAKGISYLDVVEATVAGDGLFQIRRKVGTAGHSTYRLLVKDDADWARHWDELQSLGCTYEESLENGFPLLAVDVPPECDIHAAYSSMEEGETAGAWQFEEGDVNHPVSRAN